MKKTPEHRAEMQRRREARGERSARTAEEGPSPRRHGPAKTETDVEAVKAAHDKRQRRARRNLLGAEATREGQMKSLDVEEL
jgi:hypothetical protein